MWEIRVTGRYVFFNVCEGSDPISYTIVRTNKNGKKAKCIGHGLVVAGGHLYFIEQKKDEYGTYALDGNFVRTNKNGEGKTIIVYKGSGYWKNTEVFKLGNQAVLKRGKRLYNSKGALISSKGITFEGPVYTYTKSSISRGKYKYYAAGDSQGKYRKVIRKNKITGEKKTIITIKNGYIFRFELVGGHIIFELNCDYVNVNGKMYNAKRIIVKMNGTHKKLLCNFFVS